MMRMTFDTNYILDPKERACPKLGELEKILEDMPELEPDDAQMYLDLYRGRDAEDEFAHFEEQRETNIEYLRGLPAGTGDRRAFHKEAGEITLEQMLHEWVLHDLGHIRQIAELIRARRYLAGAGPLGESYQLKP